MACSVSVMLRSTLKLEAPAPKLGLFFLGAPAGGGPHSPFITAGTMSASGEQAIDTVTRWARKSAPACPLLGA
jgi:hypothetical protein